MSKRWDGSKVHCTTHSSLWADLGVIMMDGVADLSSSSAEFDFINLTSNTAIIKPCQIVATAIQVDSAKHVDREPDHDKSIPLTESVFSYVKRKEEFLYPCIMSDEAMDAEDKQFDLDMDIIEPPLARLQEEPREKGTVLIYLLEIVHDLCEHY